MKNSANTRFITQADIKNIGLTNYVFSREWIMY